MKNLVYILGQPGIKYNDETFCWEFTHGKPDKWNKLNVIEYVSGFNEIPSELNEGIYIDTNGQAKYNIDEQTWLNLSMEVTDLITGELNLIPSDYAVFNFGTFISGNLTENINIVSGELNNLKNLINQKYDELTRFIGIVSANIIDYVNKVKPRYYTALDIVSGVNGDTYSWAENILTVTHNLETQIPTITCLVRKSESDFYEQAIIPHVFIPGNLNQIKFDCERIYRYVNFNKNGIINNEIIYWKNIITFN